MYCMKQRFNHF